MDSYGGNNSDPRSLHKYLYCADNPVNGYDPSGHDLASLSISMAVGGIIGGLSAGAAAEAQGRAVTLKEVLWGVGIGMALGPVASSSAVAACGLGIGGFAYAGLSFGPILFDKNASPSQRRASAVLIATSMFGAAAGMKAGQIPTSALETAPTDPPAGDYIILLHGTTRARALSIFKNGPDENYVGAGDSSPSDGISFVEEGQGSMDVGTPETYAAGKASQCPDEGGGVVMRIAVPRKIAEAARIRGAEFRFNRGTTELEQLKAAWNKDVWKWAPPEK